MCRCDKIIMHDELCIKVRYEIISTKQKLDLA